jgi:hypothetical protein
LKGGLAATNLPKTSSFGSPKTNLSNEFYLPLEVILGDRGLVLFVINFAEMTKRVCLTVSIFDFFGNPKFLPETFDGGI